MPLAIELAVPWLRTLTPAQLAERLDDRFALLTGGSRTSLPRHQTLRATVDWSWQLLSAPERVLARRLAVFPGGATLAAAERVCADPRPQERPTPASPTAGADGLPAAEVLTALSGLVGKSILTMTETSADGAPRYRMLETVRAYALERLAEAGEEAALRDALAGYLCELAETADPLLRTADQMRWFHLLSAEQDNMHAAPALGDRPPATPARRCASSGRLATTGCSSGTARGTGWPARCSRCRRPTRRPSGSPRRG